MATKALRPTARTSPGAVPHLLFFPPPNTPAVRSARPCKGRASPRGSSRPEGGGLWGGEQLHPGASPCRRRRARVEPVRARSGPRGSRGRGSGSGGGGAGETEAFPGGERSEAPRERRRRRIALRLRERRPLHRAARGALPPGPARVARRVPPAASAPRARGLFPPLLTGAARLPPGAGPRLAGASPGRDRWEQAGSGSRGPEGPAAKGAGAGRLPGLCISGVRVRDPAPRAGSACSRPRLRSEWPAAGRSSCDDVPWPAGG